MPQKPGTISVYKARGDVTLEGKKSQKVYHFKKDQMYPVKLLFLDISEIGVDGTRLTVNTSWVRRNFKYCEGVDWRTLPREVSDESKPSVAGESDEQPTETPTETGSV